MASRRWVDRGSLFSDDCIKVCTSKPYAPRLIAGGLFRSFTFSCCPMQSNSSLCRHSLRPVTGLGTSYDQSLFGTLYKSPSPLFWTCFSTYLQTQIHLSAGITTHTSTLRTPHRPHALHRNGGREAVPLPRPPSGDTHQHLRIRLRKQNRIR